MLFYLSCTVPIFYYLSYLFARFSVVSFFQIFIHKFTTIIGNGIRIRHIFESFMSFVKVLIVNGAMLISVFMLILTIFMQIFYSDRKLLNLTFI